MGAKFKDLTGQKFGKLTTIKRVEDHITSTGKHLTQWLCRCECGNEKIIISQSLKSGDTKSCGCSSPKKLKDLTGQTFGRLTVLKRTEDHITSTGKHLTQWLCRCECGKEAVVSSHSLLNGDTKSCGCLKKRRKMGIEDLTGQTFGKLTVLKRAEDYITPKGVYYDQWLCRCECGAEKIVKGNDLFNGTIKNCGHYGNHKLTGRKFGKLTAIKRAENYVSPKGVQQAQWLCRCECGNEITVLGTSLIRGKTKSCGCVKKRNTSKNS